MSRSKSPSVESESASSTKEIAGTASPEVKDKVGQILPYFMARGTGFGDSIAKRIEVVEVSVVEKADEPQKLEAVVVCEMTVEEDMVNGGGNLHGGCAAFLVDVCSTLPIAAYQVHYSNPSIGGVSQVINMVYHSPAQKGDKLRMVSRTLAVGARSMSSRCEIWNATHHRLVASGTHIKMEPSTSPSKAKL